MNEAIKLAIEQSGKLFHEDSCTTDPLFWQALGRALGWDSNTGSSYSCCFSQEGLKVFSKQKVGIIVGESKDKECWRVQWLGNSSKEVYSKNYILVKDWLYQAHQYFDLLLTGGDTEKFWKELLNQHQ
jgi:hypothetical protein